MQKTIPCKQTLEEAAIERLNNGQSFKAVYKYLVSEGLWSSNYVNFTKYLKRNFGVSYSCKPSNRRFSPINKDLQSIVALLNKGKNLTEIFQEFVSSKEYCRSLDYFQHYVRRNTLRRYFRKEDEPQRIAPIAKPIATALVAKPISSSDSQLSLWRSGIGDPAEKFGLKGSDFPLVNHNMWLNTKVHPFDEGVNEKGEFVYNALAPELKMHNPLYRKHFREFLEYVRSSIDGVETYLCSADLVPSETTEGNWRGYCHVWGDEKYIYRSFGEGRDLLIMQTNIFPTVRNKIKEFYSGENFYRGFVPNDIVGEDPTFPN